MNDIEFLLKELLAYYPKNLKEVNDYVKDVMPSEENHPFEYKSKYWIDRRSSRYKGAGIVSRGSRDHNEDSYFIDFERLIMNINVDEYDVSNFFDERKERILLKINEFLFECSVHKGIYFFKLLGECFVKINKRLNSFSLNQDITPNIFQRKIIDSFISNIKSIKEVIQFTYSPIYTNLDLLLSAEANDGLFEKEKSNIWYKLAKLFANGYLRIENEVYLVEGVKYNNQSEVARKLSYYFYGHRENGGSYKSFLSQTLANQNDNHNIFLKSRLKCLKHIGNQLKENGTLHSDYEVLIGNIKW